MVACEIKKVEKISNEPSYDTIKPMDYYPVYPKSWWKYVTDDSTIIVDSTSNSYRLHCYKINPDWAYDPDKPDIEYSDSFYVSFFNSGPVYGYDKIEHIQAPFGDYYTRWPILREIVGFQFHRSWQDMRYDDYREKVVVTNKFYNGNDSVLILEGTWVYGPNSNNKSYQEYVKGVGLVRELLIDKTSNDTIYTKHLTDYFISN